MVRWIFASQRPNHDFSLSFDSDVIKTYDEFDRAEMQAFQEPEKDKKGRWQLIKRNYELSLVDGAMPSQLPFRPAFRDLCNRLQICGGDLERTRQRFYQAETQTDLNKKTFLDRAKRAWFWLENHAPDEFCYTLNPQAVAVEASAEVSAGIAKLRDLIGRTDLEQIDGKDLNQLIYDEAIRGAECDAKDFFRATYQKLIGRDQGPRLPSFLKEIGRERLMELLQ